MKYNSQYQQECELPWDKGSKENLAFTRALKVATELCCKVTSKLLFQVHHLKVGRMYAFKGQIVKILSLGSLTQAKEPGSAMDGEDTKARI